MKFQLLVSLALFFNIITSFAFIVQYSNLKKIDISVRYSNLLYLTSTKHRKYHPLYEHISLHLRTNDNEEDRDYGDIDEEDIIDKRISERYPNRKSQKDNNRAAVFSGKSKWQVINRAILAGMFIAGIGTGITIDSAINTNPKDLASRDAIDKNAPNPKLCATYGSSAMVFDQRIFVTFNPFNVYVTQADTKPGCVLRQSNVVQQLQKERQLVSDVDLEACKNSYNTWGFIGDINSQPQVNCLYQSDDAQNEFLSNPKVGLGEDIYEKKKP